jgi:hypothetical protein
MSKGEKKATEEFISLTKEQTFDTESASEKYEKQKIIQIENLKNILAENDISIDKINVKRQKLKDELVILTEKQKSYLELKNKLLLDISFLDGSLKFPDEVKPTEKVVEWGNPSDIKELIKSTEAEKPTKKRPVEYIERYSKKPTLRYFSTDEENDEDLKKKIVLREKICELVIDLSLKEKTIVVEKSVRHLAIHVSEEVRFISNRIICKGKLKTFTATYISVKSMKNILADEIIVHLSINEVTFRSSTKYHDHLNNKDLFALREKTIPFLTEAVNVLVNTGATKIIWIDKNRIVNFYGFYGKGYHSIGELIRKNLSKSFLINKSFVFTCLSRIVCSFYSGKNTEDMKNMIERSNRLHISPK